MKLGRYSVVKTADKEGVAIKLMGGGFAALYEVCVRLDKGKVVVNVHHALRDQPIATNQINYLEK